MSASQIGGLKVFFYCLFSVFLKGSISALKFWGIDDLNYTRSWVYLVKSQVNGIRLVLIHIMLCRVGRVAISEDTDGVVWGLFLALHFSPVAVPSIQPRNVVFFCFFFGHSKLGIESAWQLFMQKLIWPVGPTERWGRGRGRAVAHFEPCSFAGTDNRAVV